MKFVGTILSWFRIGSVKTPAGRALVLEQFRILTGQIPVLYGVLIVDSISIAWVLPASLPWWLRFGLPGALLLVSVVRMLRWLSMRGVVPSPEQALAQLKRTRLLAGLLTACFAVWTLTLFGRVDLAASSVIALLVFMGSIGSAYCLASVPSAARLTLLLSALPISLRLLLSPEPLHICLGLNLCLLLLLLLRMMNTYYRDLVKLVASRAKVAAERERARRAEAAALEEGANAAAIAARFDSALNNMVQGLCFFDGQQRLIVCNRRYLDMYDLPEGSVGPGTHLTEIVDLRFAAGSFPAMTKAQYLAWRTDVAIGDKPSDTVVELMNHKVFLIRHRPIPGGGWVATHEDITERHRVEKALALAKADSERAEAAARAAHARLVEALDALPEGIAIFDAEDRYVLWNRGYAEAYAPNPDVLGPGVRFEDGLRATLARGQYPEAVGREEDWLRQRMARHALPQSTYEQQLAGDRWVRVEERRTSDGGSIGVRVDITDLKRREASFRLLFEESPLPMWVADIETLELLDVNGATCRHYGYTRAQLLAMKLTDLRVAEEAPLLREEFSRHRGKMPGGMVRRHVTADGRVIEVALESRPLRYAGRNACVAVAYDLTDRNRAEQRILHLARHDGLTDLPNRAALDDHLAEVLARARAEQAPAGQGGFAVLCLDLDRFKQINDLFGHAMGDAALREASRRMQAVAKETPEGAFLARIGGDEFIAIIGGGPLPASAELLARRLQGALEPGISVDGHDFELGLSAGIAVYPRDGADARALLANADAALYRAKHDGRGTIRFFTPAMDRQLRDRRALEHDLRAAIAADALSLEYQPQFRADGRIIGFEALARWHHPTRGAVAPADFISVAEESGLIVELGQWVLREACREASTWTSDLHVAVNVSAVQFRRGNLQDTVRAVLRETGLPPARLELEITEGVLIENVARATSMLNGLKRLGMRIALDDFGTGYSSLSYLQSFPLDRIKIDRSFVAELGRSDRALAIVRAVIGLAHGLGLPALAEGVETPEQHAALAREGCDEMQGYLLGRPRPIAVYAELAGRAERERKTASV